MNNAPFGWFGIMRLGLVQTALGSIVVLTTSTINRVMVVELALAAMLPGALVALHYAVQVLRPRWGYGSDVGGRVTPWIIGGMMVLATGGLLAAVATAMIATAPYAGYALAALAFTMIGIGVGAAGTSLLVLLAKRVSEDRRPAAAAIVWLMMIAGFAVTASVAGHYLDPFSATRLVIVAGVISCLALAVTCLAVLGVEGDSPSAASVPAVETRKPAFREALQDVWDEPLARRFTIFVFVSMLAYSAQDLILEPFAGTVFGMTPGESTKLAGVQHGGVFLGMVLVGLLATGVRGRKYGSLKAWTIAGCILSGAMLLGLACAGVFGGSWPLKANVFALGFANGIFAVAAIGSMMTFASRGAGKREGVRMGLWGAAQGTAFGLGGFSGTAAADLARYLMADPSLAYATVFALEGTLFILTAFLAARLGVDASAATAPPAMPKPYASPVLSGRS